MRENIFTYNETSITLRFLNRHFQTRREWSDMFKALQEKTTAKFFFKNKIN